MEGEGNGVDVGLRPDTRPSSRRARHRAALAALRVSAARLRSQPLRPVLVVAGVALAFAMTVAIVGGSLVARQQALGRALGGLPESAQGFRVDRFGTPLSRQTYAREDRAVRRVLGTLSPGAARRVVFFRQLRVAGRLVEIAAVDGLQQVVRLRSGRLPRTCTPVSCEVLQIGGGGDARLHQGDVRLDRVGIAELRDPGLFGYISAAAAGPAAPPSVLIAPSVDSLERLPSLQPFYRVYSWLSPLRANGLQYVGRRPHPGRRVAWADLAVRDGLRFPPEQPGRRTAVRDPARNDRRPAPDPRRRRDERAAARVRDHRRDRAAPRARQASGAACSPAVHDAGRRGSRSRPRSAR